MGARLFQGPGPADVRLLVEARGHFDQYRHLLAVLGGPDQRGNHRAVPGCAVEALLDGQDVGIVGRLVHHLLDRGGKRVVGVVHEHVLAVEHLEDAGVLLPLDGGEGVGDEWRPRLVVELGRSRAWMAHMRSSPNGPANR